MSKINNMFGGTPWNAIESSPLYHLITWGYTNKEITEMVADKFPTRTPKAVNQQISLIRKWVSYIQDYPVSNYNASKKNEKMYNKASQFAPGVDIIKFKRNKDFKPASVYLTSKKTGEPSPVVNLKKVEAVKPKTLAETEAEYFQDAAKHTIQSYEKVFLPPSSTLQPIQPSAIEVIKMAKELGAKEVEVQGIKIRF